MTQEKRNTFLTSVPVPMLIMYLEDNDQSEDKNDSQLSGTGLSEEAEQLIEELDNMHGDAKEKIFKLIDTLRHDGLKDHQIGKVLVDRVKFVSRTTLYEYMPKELKRDYTRKPLPKTINISTPHKVIEQPTDEDIKRLQTKREAEIVQELEAEEDPKDVEIQFLKEQNEELKDALHKTEQFRPATQLQQEQPIANADEHYFKWLADKANGIQSFYYDRYGIDLFKNRILSQLKNSGVTTFKRLYFEV